MYKFLSVFLTTTMLVSGCTDEQLDRLESVGKPPPMSTFNNPTEHPNYKPISWPAPVVPEVQRTANSLWNPTSKTFFRDQRAAAVGDILTVQVSISDKASLDNKSSRTRTGNDTVNLPSIFGLQNKIVSHLPAGTANPLVDVGSTTNTNGEGKIDRSETVNTQVAALITQVLPNGNFVIYGSQEVRVNFEVRQLTVQGVVRPQDVTPLNTVALNQIAEARVSYGGKGQQTDVQQPRIGQQVVDILSPF